MAFNLLIVDDSKTVRTVILRALEISGVPVNQTYQAENGEEGLKILAEEWIDLVLADINMPVMNGVEMIRHIVADEDLAKTPVVVVSTEGSETRRAELKELGVRDFLRKPFKPEDLHSAVVNNLGKINE